MVHCALPPCSPPSPGHADRRRPAGATRPRRSGCRRARARRLSAPGGAALALLALVRRAARGGDRRAEPDRACARTARATASYFCLAGARPDRGAGPRRPGSEAAAVCPRGLEAGRRRSRPVRWRSSLAAGACSRVTTSTRVFEQAIAHHAMWDNPFERARTELCFGERLRRARRRREAREHLRSAGETFEQLAAEPWAARAATELRATGETVRRRDPTADEELTPQELQIAIHAADGRSEPRDWRGALPEPADGRVPPDPGVPQAQHPLEGGADPALLGGWDLGRRAGLTRSPSPGPPAVGARSRMGMYRMA